MSLREGDSLPFLRFKQNLADTDCNAIFSNGTVEPVLIRNGGSQLFVERDYNFYDPEKLPGFVRFEHKPDAQPQIVEAPPPAEPYKLKGSTWGELKADAERQNRQALAERHEANQAQQGIPATRDSAFARASHKFAQEVAASRGQSGPNSKVR
jgi:hypothetical protein